MTFGAFEIVSGFVIAGLGLLSLRVAIRWGPTVGWWAPAPEGPLKGSRPLAFGIAFTLLGAGLVAHGLVR